MNVDRRSIGFLFGGTLIGSSMGIAAGILLAPKSGKKLRDDFRRKTDKTFKRVSHRVRGIF